MTILVYIISSLRLNSSDSDGEPLYIQMVTALVFQLIQCVVQSPSERDAEDDHNKKVNIRFNISEVIL